MSQFVERVMKPRKLLSYRAVLVFTVGLAFARQNGANRDGQSNEIVEADQLDSQVGTLFKQQQFDKALPLAQRELMLRENALGPNHPAVADVSRNVGELFFAKGKYKEAAAAYKRFLQIYESAYGADSPKLLDGLYRYVSILIAENQRVAALDIEKHAFRIENGVDFDRLQVQKNKNVTETGLIGGLVTIGSAPIFPQDAKRVGISGSVVMKVTVDEKGHVNSVNVLSGHPLLTGVSEFSARRSTYAPALMEGRPVKVTGILMYHFNMTLNNNSTDHSPFTDNNRTDHTPFAKD
jgi:tetratricopeptide (TPR) repeat protein